MVNQIALGILLVGQIALAGCVIYLREALDKTTDILERYRELFQITKDTLQVISTEQDRHTAQMEITEERIMNLQNKTGQMSVKLKKMDANTIYEVKDDQH